MQTPAAPLQCVTYFEIRAGDQVIRVDPNQAQELINRLQAFLQTAPKGIPMEILEALAKRWRTTVDQLRGDGREQPRVFQRQMAMYVLRRKTGLSARSIGKFFGKDPGTVGHALNQVNSVMDIDAHCRLEVNECLAVADRTILSS